MYAYVEFSKHWLESKKSEVNSDYRKEYNQMKMMEDIETFDTLFIFKLTIFCF